MLVVEAIRSFGRAPRVAFAAPWEPATQPPLPVAARVRGDRVQPSARVAQWSLRPKMFNEPREGFLDDILRRIGLPQHGQRQPIQAARVQFKKR